MRRIVVKFIFSYKSFMEKVGFNLDLTFSRFFFWENTCLVMKHQV